MTNRVDINEYIRLYEEHGLSLDRIKPLKNETYKIFKSSRAKIKIVDRKRVYENPLPFERIQFFVKNNPYFYMIPVTTINETIVGFLLRGVTRSEYSTVSREFDDISKQVPLMFGLNKVFKNLDKFKSTYPIVVCEGCKDCLTLQKFYPFVVAINTSSMGLNLPILRNISNKFLLAYDNDKAGQEGMDRDSKELKNSGAYVDILKLEDGFKDCAEFVRDPERLKQLASQLNRRLKTLHKLN